MLCDNCNEREANVFSCIIVHGQQSARNLCEQCSREYFREQQQEFETLSSSGAWTSRQPLPPGFPSNLLLDGTQHCYYCDAVATSATMNQGPTLAVRQQSMHYTCLRCGKLARQFTLEGLATIPDGLTQEEQRQRIEQIIREVDDRVRQHIRNETS